MDYSQLGTYMGGGLPTVDDVTIPHTVDPSLYVPTKPAAPTTQPGVMARVNPFMARLGQALMSPEGKKALAIGTNVANTVGRTRNWAGPLSRDMAGIMGQGAVANLTGGTTPPADNRSVLEQMKPQQTQAKQVQPLVDQNQNGVPDSLEAKVNISGEPTRVQQTLSQLLGGGQGFSQGLGDNVGTPESSTVPTSVQNSNVGMSDQSALELIAATLGPDAAIKLASERAGRVAPEMAARASLIEADIKNRMFEPTLAKTQAEILKNKADAAKTIFEMSPEYITQKGAIAGAEETAKKEAEAKVVRQEFDRVVKDAANIPVYEPTLRAQGFTNYGELWLALGKTAPEVVSAAMRATAEKASAGITGASLQKSALATLAGTLTTRLAQLNKLEIPLAPTDPGYNDQRVRFIAGSAMPASEALIMEKNNLQRVHGAVVQALSGMGGADVGGSTPRRGRSGHPLSGKPAGRYSVGGNVVRWDGTKEIK